MGSGKRGSDVSLVVKYFLFGFNFLFWLASACTVAIGAYAYIQKEQYRPNDSGSDGFDIYTLVFDLSIIFIIIGGVMFIVSFLGCIGALRENTIFLNIFAVIVGIAFLAEVIGAVLVFVFKDEIVKQVEKELSVEGIVRYRDDPDFHDLVNWAQEEFDCCGVSEDGFRDWDKNEYFNCSIGNISPERCGVPYSCCKNPDNIQKGVTNTMCGWGVQEKTDSEAAEYIHTVGCVQAVIDWAELNLYLVGGIAVGVAVIQLVVIMLARLLAGQVETTKETAELSNRYRHR